MIAPRTVPRIRRVAHRQGGSADFLVFDEYVTMRFPIAHPLAAADIAVGTALVVLTLEVTRRTLGSIACGMAGPWLPGPLRHRGLTYAILIDQTPFTTEG